MIDKHRNMIEVHHTWYCWNSWIPSNCIYVGKSNLTSSLKNFTIASSIFSSSSGFSPNPGLSMIVTWKIHMMLNVLPYQFNLNLWATTEPPVLSFSAGFNSMPNFPVGAPSKPNVEAVLGVVPVVLVPADQHVGKTGLAHPRSTQDDKTRTRVPEKLTCWNMKLEKVSKCELFNFVIITCLHWWQSCRSLLLLLDQQHRQPGSQGEWWQLWCLCFLLPMFSSSLRYQLKESVGLGWKSFFKISGPTLSGERTTLSQVVLNTEMLKVNTDVPSGMLMLMTPTLTILKLRSYNAESVVISHSTSTNHMFNMWCVELLNHHLLICYASRVQ